MWRPVSILIVLFLCMMGCQDELSEITGTTIYTGINLFSHTKSDDIDRIVADFTDDYRYISVGLIIANEIYLTRSYGSDRIDEKDVYASVSKPVTSEIFFQLLEKGDVASVDDPIELYSVKYKNVMPEEYKDTPISFRHLLSHQSGIPHHDRIWKDGKLDLAFEPGTSTLYSTRAYGVLGEVMEEITGLSYGEMLSDYIASPLGANSFSVPPLLFEAPGGLVSSTIHDMALFARGVMLPLYVSDSIQYQIQWVPSSSDQNGEICLGWYISHYGMEDMAIYHAGSNGRPRAFIALHPKQGMGVVLLGKHQESDGEQRFYMLAHDLIGYLETKNAY